MSMRTYMATGAAALILASAAFSAPQSEAADAAMNRNRELIAALIAKKTDINAPQPDGSTALHWAVYYDDAALVDMLLQAGANVKLTNRDGATPLYLACVNGDAVVIDKLLKAGADANGTLLLHGETPLMVASRSGHMDAVKLLLDRAANVNAKENLRETTALMWAAEQNHPDVVKLLIEHGADVNTQSKKEAIKKQYGVNYKIKEGLSAGGMTPLVLAAREGALGAVTALLDAKADPDKTSGDGSTAMLVAVQNGHYDVATYLVQHGANINLAND
jgi:ankyrin repeat protein